MRRARLQGLVAVVAALAAAASVGVALADHAAAGARELPPRPPPPELEKPRPFEAVIPTAGQLAAFHAAVTSADRMVAHGRDGTAEPGRFESTDRRDIEGFDAALFLTAPDERMRDFCEGTPEVKLYRAGQLVAIVTYHHGSVMRADRWDTDLFLDDPEPLIRWFSDRGIPGPQREQEERLAAQRKEEEWFAAMPESLLPYRDDMRDADWPEFDLEPLRPPLARQYPATADRVRALYGWYGSGAGPWSGYPAYEGAAERLLLEYPIEDLLAVASETRLTPAQVEGAARLLAGWDFSQRRADDLQKVAPSLKAKLLAHAMASDDEDKRRRAEVAFSL